MSKNDRGAAARAAFIQREADRKADNAAAAREEAEKNRPPVMCLGKEGACNVYWTRSSGATHKLRANEHNKNNLLFMARFDEYARWIRPDLPPDDAEKQESAILRRAARLLMEDSLGKFYDYTKERGRGIWADPAGGWVYNAGDFCWHVPADGGKIELIDQVRSGCVYASGVALPHPSDNPLTDEEGRALVGLMNRTWTMPGGRDIMSGWWIAAMLSGVLKMSPHVWINAPSDTGKTYFFADLTNLLGMFSKYQESIPTEAGVRQDLNGDALGMMIDEVEPGDSEKGQKKISDLLDLMRSASFGTQPKKKGSIDGVVKCWRVKASYALFSIANHIYRDSDSSRCLVLDLCKKSTRERKKIWAEQEAGRALVHTPGFHGRLIARLLACLPVLMKNIDMLRDYLGSMENVETRRVEIFSTIFACRHVLVSRERMNQEAMQEAAAIMQAYGEQEEQESDFSRCLGHLLSIYKINVYGAGEMNVSTACKILQDSTDVERKESITRALNLAGLRWNDNKGVLQVDKRPDKMKRIFAGTQWSNGKISKVLAEGCSKKGIEHANAAGVWLASVRWGGCAPIDCIMIPAALVLE